MNEMKETHWSDRISEYNLRMMSLFLMCSTLLVNNIGLSYTVKAFGLSAIMLSWVVLGIVYVVKYKGNRKLNKKIPR